MNDVKWLGDHIVDLTKTPWDKAKSKPEKGEFVFTGPKVYQRRGSDSPWKFGFFIRYAPPYNELTMMPATYGITPVLASEALAYPEGLVPNSNGYYQFGDVILAKESRESFLRRRADSIGGTDRQIRAEKSKFKEDVENSGSKAEMNFDV